MTVQPRGIRNNNPGNIDRDGTKWQGMAPDQSSDPRFVVFTTPQYGLRALAKVLLSYQKVHGLNTVAQIITRWAPPGPDHNDTTAYIADVAGDVGVRSTDVIDVDNVEVMLPLVNAIVAHENANYRYPEAVVMEGLRLAGISDAKPKPLAKQNTFLAQAGSGAALLGAGAVHVASTAASYAPTVKGAVDQLTPYTGAPVIQHAVTVLLTVAGGLTAVGIVAEFLKHRSA
jgi:hypothetical protein